MADNSEKKWVPLDAPPPPLFTGEPERNLVKQVNDELINRIIGTPIVYYAINHELTSYHPLYGESIEKFFHDPIHINGLIHPEDQTTTVNAYGVDRRSTIRIFFQKKRLNDDLNLEIRSGDFIRHGKVFYEIATTVDNKRWLFGRSEHQFEVMISAIRSRESLFKGE